MARNFKETAHLKTDLKKYGENYERIFGKKKLPEHKLDAGDYGSHGETKKTQADEKEMVYQGIKELARKAYRELPSGQDTEGFPESSSFIYGFIEGYKKAQEES